MIKKLKNNKFKIVTFFLITLLFKPLWLFNNTNLGAPGDDMSYWLHSATLAFDQDFNYLNDYEINHNIFNPETNAPAHPPGAGYLASPFVYLFSLFDKVAGTTDAYTRINPVKSFAYAGYFIAGLIYTFFGSYFLSKIVKKYNNKYAGLLLFSGLMSTLIHFVSTRFLMSHASEFFLCSLIIYIFEKNDNKYLSKNDITKLVLTYFLLAITRPSTFLYSLILFLVYRNKFVFNKNFISTYIIQLSGFLLLYISLSRKLYTKNYILLNSYGEYSNQYTSSLTFDQFLKGFVDLPNLFLSTNMGIAFSTPIVFLAFIVFLKNYLRENGKILDKVSMFFYFSASFFPLLIWQGREVAYGQRLLIGIIPLCIIITSKYLVENYLVASAKFLTFVSYSGYILFYSFEKLTLRPGTTLWGTKVGYTAENYYLEVFKAFTNYEIILSALLRNIYSVDFFKFFNLKDSLSESSLVTNLSIQKIEKFLSYTDTYQSLDISYLVLVNIAIFTFSFFYTKIISQLSR